MRHWIILLMSMTLPALLPPKTRQIIYYYIFKKIFTKNILLCSVPANQRIWWYFYFYKLTDFCLFFFIFRDKLGIVEMQAFYFENKFSVKNEIFSVVTKTVKGMPRVLLAMFGQISRHYIWYTLLLDNGRRGHGSRDV